jgi:hypothetical protein
MPKYLKIAPDPDAPVCHCGEGNPDCEHWESCDGCGMDYRKTEGHDCIDYVHVEDVWTLAKELRDALEASQTALVAETNAHAATRAMLATRLGCECSEAQQCAMGAEIDRLRAQIAALQPEERRVGPDRANLVAAIDDLLARRANAKATISTCMALAEAEGISRDSLVISYLRNVLMAQPSRETIRTVNALRTSAQAPVQRGEG